MLNYIDDKFPQITSLQYVINNKGNDTIYDQEVITFSGKDHIVEEMEGLKFKINAKSFYQTNSDQAYELYKITRQFADLKGDEIVYDLYTGTGTIAQFIAKKAKKIIGIESVPEAIADAKVNAEINGIKNTDFFVGDMAKVFTEEFISKNGRPDVIITDPPRDGMHKKVIGEILKILPKKVVLKLLENNVPENINKEERDSLMKQSEAAYDNIFISQYENNFLEIVKLTETNKIDWSNLKFMILYKYASKDEDYIPFLIHKRLINSEYNHFYFSAVRYKGEWFFEEAMEITKGEKYAPND